MPNDPKLPPLTKCPQCLNWERTTACRFCGVSKLGHLFKVKPPPVFIVDDEQPGPYGTKGVTFAALHREKYVLVKATIAPPDVEVGILDPWPLHLEALDSEGVRMEVTYPEARRLISPIALHLF